MYKSISTHFCFFKKNISCAFISFRKECLTCLTGKYEFLMWVVYVSSVYRNQDSGKKCFSQQSPKIKEGSPFLFIANQPSKSEVGLELGNKEKKAEEHLLSFHSMMSGIQSKCFLFLLNGKTYQTQKMESLTITPVWVLIDIPAKKN